MPLGAVMLQLQQAGKLLHWKGTFITFFFSTCFYPQTDSSRTFKTQIFHESKGKKTLPKPICAEGGERSYQMHARYGESFIGVGASIAGWAEWGIVNGQNETSLLYLLAYATIRRNYLEILECLNGFSVGLGFFLLLCRCHSGCMASHKGLRGSSYSLCFSELSDQSLCKTVNKAHCVEGYLTLLCPVLGKVKILWHKIVGNSGL